MSERGRLDSLHLGFSKGMHTTKNALRIYTSAAGLSGIFFILIAVVYKAALYFSSSLGTGGGRLSVAQEIVAFIFGAAISSLLFLTYSPASIKRNAEALSNGFEESAEDSIQISNIRHQKILEFLKSAQSLVFMPALYVMSLSVTIVVFFQAWEYISKNDKTTVINEFKYVAVLFYIFLGLVFARLGFLLFHLPKVSNANSDLDSRRGRLQIDPPSANWGAMLSRRSALNSVLRRFFDVFLAVLYLILVLPLIVIVSLAIRLESPGPILQAQARVGKDGRVFSLLTFRCVTVASAAPNANEWLPLAESKVTRIGRLLRRTSIDEIPQILNILRGEMSWVGPRPHSPSIAARLSHTIPHYNYRNLILPGLISWANVNYPHYYSEEDAYIQLSFDLFYVKNRSIWLDFIILLSAVRIILFSEMRKL